MLDGITLFSFFSISRLAALSEEMTYRPDQIDFLLLGLETPEL